MADPRREIRIATLAQSRALEALDRAIFSDHICTRFLASRAFSHHVVQGLRVALFRPLPEEPSHLEIERMLSGRGAILHYPRVVPGAEVPLEFVAMPPPSEGAGEWEVGPYDILQPAASQAAIPLKDLDWIFVPGVAFGGSGERLGRGGGYYDRVLAAAPRALRISLAFDHQIHPTLPQAEWDQPVHLVFTPQRELRAPAWDEWLAMAAGAESATGDAKQ